MNYRQQAQGLARLGRNGDTMLVHMNPVEVAGIAALTPKGLTTNPDTGLPEAFNFMETLLPIAATAVGTAFGGPLGGAAANAATTAAVTGDLERGLVSGAMGYGIGSALDATMKAGAGITAEAMQAAAPSAGVEMAAQNAMAGVVPGVAETALPAAAAPTGGMIASGAEGMQGLKNMWAGRESFVGNMAKPGALIPTAIGAGQLAQMDYYDQMGKDGAALEKEQEAERREAWNDLQRGYMTAQPGLAPGLSPYRAGMSYRTPQPMYMAGGGHIRMPMGGVIPYERGGRSEEEQGYDPYRARYGSAGYADMYSIGNYAGGRGDMFGGGGNPGYGGIDPVSVQAGLRGIHSVAPPPGYMAGFAPEFQYFQNDPNNVTAPRTPSIPELQNMYAGSPINRFMQPGNTYFTPGPNSYFQSVLPQPEQVLDAVAHEEASGRTKGVPRTGPVQTAPVPSGDQSPRVNMADGGTVPINTSRGPQPVQAGGIANLGAEMQGAPMPGEQEVMQVAAALMGQVENPDAIINAFIEAYGPETFAMIRDMILQQVNPGAQTEGMVQGPGGGMDDQVPGTIGDGSSTVAVSPGEYIVPADVVSGLGSGSSDAGAEQLDEMSQNVRRARQGGQINQPPPIDPRAVRPA